MSCLQIFAAYRRNRPALHFLPNDLIGSHLNGGHLENSSINNRHTAIAFIPFFSLFPRGETLFHFSPINILEIFKDFPPTTRKYSKTFHRAPENIQRLFRLQICLGRKSQLFSGNIQRLFGLQSTAATSSGNQQQQPAAATSCTNQQQQSAAATSSINQQHQPAQSTSSSNQQQQPMAAINSSNQQQQSTAAINSSNQQQQSTAAINSSNQQQQSTEAINSSNQQQQPTISTQSTTTSVSYKSGS